MSLHTKGYLVVLFIVIILEIVMINLYIDAANSFDPYYWREIFNMTKDNEYEGGIALLMIAIVLQIFVAVFLIARDARLDNNKKR